MEGVSAPIAVPVARGRRLGFRIVLGLFIVASVGLGLALAIPALFAGSEKIHRFHDYSSVITLTVLLGMPGIAIWRAPERAVASHQMLMAAVVSTVLALVLSAKFEPFSLILVALVVAILALSPGRGGMFRIGRVDPILMVLVVAAAVPLIAYALTHSELQRTDHVSEHAEFTHWLGIAQMAISIVLAGAIAALRAPGWRIPAWAAGGAGLLLGLGSLALEGAPSALETAWAWVAIGGGALFLAAAEVEARRELPTATPYR